MRLLRLRLLNFRQHADTTIEFAPGLTGIVGPNGSGKSTILEAIAWAIYGASAARGTNDTIRFARAPGRSRVEVELLFELGGHEYRVARSLSSAEVFVDGGTTPVASTLGGVSEYLQKRLGMSREEFFNTYFTGQKELQFLAQMGPAQRGRFLGQVLGYERLRTAQERARTRRNELRHEIEGLRAGLPDPAALRADREGAEARLAEATASLAAAQAERAAADLALAEFLPRWEAAQAARDEARDAAHALEVATRDAEAAERDAARARRELDAVAEAEARLAPLQERLAELPGIEEECRRMAVLAREEERRRALREQERQLQDELAEMARRIEALEQAPALLEQARADADALLAELTAAETAVEEQTRDWTQEQEKVRTQLDFYGKRHGELKEQIEQLREAGPEGSCPTCERPLLGQFDAVVGRLEDELSDLVRDRKWLENRATQLKKRPEALVEAEAARAQLKRSLETKQQRAAKCERAVEELKDRRGDRAAKEAQLSKLREELDRATERYDADRHREADRRLAELRELERLAARSAATAEARPAREKQLAEAEARIEAAAGRVAAARARREAIAFDESEFARLGDAFHAAGERLRRGELEVTRVQGTLDAAEQALETALRALAAYEEKRERLGALEVEQRHLNELDAVFTQLRGELNARVRPELGELASSFLNDITNGRYTSLEIDDSYNILVLDEGEEKPVISGGEEDIANLVLRLAISQMIAERAGHPLNLLILDEVFGSLDLERRDNVVQLLHRLQDRFEQVILITHVETIREGLDQVLRVSFDERSGSSVVTVEERPEAELEVV